MAERVGRKKATTTIAGKVSKKKESVGRKKTSVVRTPLKKTNKKVVLNPTKASKRTRKTQTSVVSVQSKSIFSDVGPKIKDVRHGLVLGAYQFPVDSVKFMSQFARMSGVTIALIGAVATLWFSQYAWQYGVVTTVVDSQYQKAELLTATTDTVTSIINSATEPIVVSSSQDQTNITINQDAPLQGTVLVKVSTPDAYKVEIFVFEESWQNKERLGEAKQVDDAHWEFPYDTTRLTDGKNYKFSAGIWEASQDSDVPDYTVQLDYMLVDNTPQQSEDSTTTIENSVDETPVVEITSPGSVVSGLISLKVAVSGASKVALEVREKTSGSTNMLYNATMVDSAHWRVSWDTTRFNNGEYDIKARVTNQYGTYVDGTAIVEVKNTLTAGVDAVVATVEDVVHEVIESTTTVLPTLALRVSSGAEFSGTQKIEAELKDGQATTVYFYIRDLLSATPRFIGAAVPTSGTRWYLNWYTSNTPNGTYKLFALSNTSVGIIRSDEVSIAIKNITAPTTIATNSLNTITSNVQTAVTDTMLTAPATETKLIADTSSSVSSHNSTTSIQRDTVMVLSKYQEQFDAELIRLGAALRSGDEGAVVRIKNRITTLISAIITNDPELTAEDRAQFETRVEEIIADYETQVDAVNKLLTARQQADLLKDTDGDGITDYDEVAIYNTDPTVADTDNDGFTDGAEILAGFDPLSDIRESVITYESPKEAGVFREDILKIDSITSVSEQLATTTDVRTVILLAGKALPGSYVTLYMYSTPVIVTVKTDAEGSWQYRFEQELEDGQHNIYVGITDNAGKIVAKSQPLAFIKEAQAVIPLQAASLDEFVQGEPTGSLFTSNYAIYALVSASVAAMGLVLILLGLHLESRRRPLSEGVS